MGPNRLRIMIVENEAAHAEAIRSAFEAAGTDVEIQVSGTLREYRESVAAGAPDIALVDPNLPDGRAVDVLTSPPEAGPFPILIMTGYGTEQAAVEAMRSGALDYIVKSPEAFADMPSTVARVLREWNVLKERKRAEEKWRESESRYRMLVENIPQKIFIKDSHSVYVSCNKNYARDLSITPEESAGKTDYDFFPKELADKYRADDRRIMETGIEEAIDEKYIQYGKEIWVHTGKTPVRNEQGDVVGVLGIFTDITERKKAEEELRKSEERFRALAETTSDMIWEVDKNGVYTYINQKIKSSLGYDPSEMIGKKTPFDVMTPEDKVRVGEIFRALAESRKPFANLENWNLHKDGRRVLLESSGVPILDSQGQYAGYRGIDRDITERKKTEEEKLQASEKLTVLVKKLEGRNYQNIIMGEMREMLQACSTMEEAGSIIRGLMEKLFPNSEGALFMMSPSRSDLESVARWGDFPEDVDDNVFAPDACWALRRGRTYIVENVSVGPLCPHLKHPPSTAYMCLPLVAKSDVLGLLHLRSRQSTQIQTKQNMISDLKDMAVILSEYLSLSIANIQLNERLARESVRDPLTGLFNRRFMIESLAREIKRAERNQTQVGIIMADIDHFKQFNDKYGHAAGDKVLTQMGGFFKSGARGSDVACRYGGEEFVLFLPESSAENTFKRADQIREEVKNLKVHHGGELLASITLSMGISTYPDQGSNAEDLLRVADAALYRAKQEGRDRVTID